ERQERRIARLHAAREENRVCDPVLIHPIFDQINTEVDVTTHLDCTAEGDFPITLREMQIAARELGAWDVDGIVDLRAAGEVLDIMIPAVLARWYGAGTLAADFLQLGAL